jgi:hypothetical protein
VLKDLRVGENLFKFAILLSAVAEIFTILRNQFGGLFSQSDRSPAQRIPSARIDATHATHFNCSDNNGDRYECLITKIYGLSIFILLKCLTIYYCSLASSHEMYAHTRFIDLALREKDYDGASIYIYNSRD